MYNLVSNKKIKITKTKMQTKNSIVSETRLVFLKNSPERQGSPEKREVVGKTVSTSKKEMLPEKQWKRKLKRRLNESIDTFGDFLGKNVDRLSWLGLVEKFAIKKMNEKMTDLSGRLVSAETQEEIEDVSEEYVSTVKQFGGLVLAGLKKHELVKGNLLAHGALSTLESAIDNLEADDVADMVANLNMLLDFLPEPPKY